MGCNIPAIVRAKPALAADAPSPYTNHVAKMAEKRPAKTSIRRDTHLGKNIFMFVAIENTMQSHLLKSKLHRAA